MRGKTFQNERMRIILKIWISLLVHEPAMYDHFSIKSQYFLLSELFSWRINNYNADIQIYQGMKILETSQEWTEVFC